MTAIPCGLILVCILIACFGCRTADPYPISEVVLTSQTNMPHPLVMLDGRHVTSRSQWTRERKPELKALFQHYMYGWIPPAPKKFQIHELGEFQDFLDGQAILKTVRISTGPAPAPQIDLMLILPKKRSGPVPVFLALNFCGNHALVTDPRVPLSPSWMGKNCPGCVDHRATDASRGTQTTNWPIAEIVSRGYGLATFYNGDIDADRPEASEGLYAFLAEGDLMKNSPTNRGTIAAWAWGFMRCMDYLLTNPAVDRHRIAAVGHSRNGKTALLAAAFDERIAMAFPHQAGCGGTAPSRSIVGESVKAINDHFPHWFNAEFKKFNDAPDKLPFDQNCLVALCAPRPVLLSSATDDQWSNPDGQFEVAKAADPVYRLLGASGLATATMPPVGTRVGKQLGFYEREGKHSMTPADWRVFMDFADLNWNNTAADASKAPVTR
jgi:hypothetical protein